MDNVLVSAVVQVEYCSLAKGGLVSLDLRLVFVVGWELTSKCDRATIANIRQYPTQCSISLRPYDYFPSTGS
jgi:hypothetical protein